ncbi:MAG: membrane protein insertase YidC [Bdellovibrionales bacterium]|nr:membrane protein insertase YidC [Bdellovibrionales bacterium]
MNNNDSFLDKNTILAIALSIVFFIGWQFYVQEKYPPQEENKTQATTAVDQSTDNVEPSQPVVKTDPKPLNESTETRSEIQNAEENFVDFQGENLSFKISSRGMGLSDLKLIDYTNRQNENIHFGTSANKFGNFATLFKGQPVDFQIHKEGDNVFVGRGETPEAYFEKRMEFTESQYFARVSTKVQWKTGTRNLPVETYLGDVVQKAKKSMFLPAYEGTEFFNISEGSEERERINSEKSMKGTYTNVTLASIGSQYFAVALKDETSVLPNSQVLYDPESQIASTQVLHTAMDGKDIFEISYLAYMGPKKYDILREIDAHLTQMINYGMFSVLSKPIFSLLKWLYSILQNWGFSIIVLTILVRMLLLPINVSAFRSMKKMQKIQPQLKAIKEKYKDDAARINQETMALMKKEKANPLGGCLPMLLQLPVFFALYSVLGQSVELYKSPFIFWIHDLSFKDPFYVLPISVALLYFLQMNLTPNTTMDPAQAKMMKFIPLLFGFFMISVPSGLTLYFFVNTVFGIGQQLLLKGQAAA